MQVTGRARLGYPRIHIKLFYFKRMDRTNAERADGVVARVTARVKRGCWNDAKALSDLARLG